jgi:3-phosphoshikimate 1-carboxyvinyltransferase
MKTIKPFQYSGEIQANSSKSQVQRLLAIALLSKGETVLTGFELCDDTKACLAIIEQLGAHVTGQETLTIKPSKQNIQNEINLFVHESGLSLRMFAFIATLFGEKISLTASGTLINRPVNSLKKSLEKSGLTIIHSDSNYPVEYRGKIKDGLIELDGSESSQTLTGLLIASPLLSADTTISVSNLISKPYIDLTIQLMEEFGVFVTNENYKTFKIAGNQKYVGREIEIEGDWSGAANHIIGAAISGEIKLKGLKADSTQADKICLQIVQQFGAITNWDNGDLIIKKAQNPAPIEVDLTDNPDLFPILAILACAAEGSSTFTGTNRLIYKESNRLQTVEEMLQVFGVSFSTYENSIIIHGKGKIIGDIINSHNDHRIAMAATVAACISENEITVVNPSCVGKSYPKFFNDLGL